LVDSPALAMSEPPVNVTMGSDVELSVRGVTRCVIGAPSMLSVAKSANGVCLTGRKAGLTTLSVRTTEGNKYCRVQIIDPSVPAKKAAATAGRRCHEARAKTYRPVVVAQAPAAVSADPLVDSPLWRCLRHL